MKRGFVLLMLFLFCGGMSEAIANAATYGESISARLQVLEEKIEELKTVHEMLKSNQAAIQEELASFKMWIHKRR